MMKITLELTREEWAEMKALAIRYGTSATDILQGFASDLTFSNRCHGSDESDMARGYIKRRLTDRSLSGATDPLSESEEARQGHYRDISLRARLQERARRLRAQEYATQKGSNL